MKRLFDTSIDVHIRQFYILAFSGCLGNLCGFLGNALIYGLSPATIFCGICAIFIFLTSFVGIISGHPLPASYVIIALLAFVEFPLLYYIYGSGTIVYMILAIVSIAVFIPPAHAPAMAVPAILLDLAVVVLDYLSPSEFEPVTPQSTFSSTLCSMVIVLISVFLITLLLKLQQEKQAAALKTLSEQLQNAADHDALTALYNRRFLNQYLDDLIRQGQTDFYAVLLDLDYFKKINDTYGHVFGDEVLVAFGQILQKHVGDQGIAVRFGGEEFMLILPEQTTDSIKQLLTSARTDYKNFIKEQKNVVYSFSSGVARHTPGMEVSTLYSLADEKLYQAKNGNRDRDVFA